MRCRGVDKQAPVLTLPPCRPDSPGHPHRRL